MQSSFDNLFTAFKHQYELTVPPPKYSIASLLGWQFVLSLIWATFAVLMVSSQTASEFYQSKIMSGMNGTLAILASGSVLIAVEGGIVIGAAIKAATKREYSTWLINFAIGLSVFISIVAGINSSIGIVEGIDPVFLYYLRLGLVFVLGFGGSLVAWAAGEVVGAQLAKAFLDREKTIREFNEKLAEYNKMLLAAWRASPEYTLAKADVRDQADEVHESRRSRKSTTQQSTERHESGLHYRRLSKDQKQQILKMPTSEVMRVFALDVERTAQNWKSFARRDKENGLLD